MPATKTVQWKACSKGHVFLGTRGCPACERANGMRSKLQKTRRTRRQALNAAGETSGRKDLVGKIDRQKERPSLGR